ncbi:MULTISPECIES: hypothetical protein [unclassified Micromonospora]|uniref:hypothetical protein n=1 Tax=unclassified Micromonospora TaxID=2617518 RepID=UPI0036414F6F
MSNHLKQSGVANPTPRNRRKKWLATGIAGMAGVVGLGMMAATNASAVTRLDDSGGHQSQKDGSGRGEGWDGHDGGRPGEDGRHITPVPCNVTALFAAINRANQHLGGTLKLARGCTYELRTGTATATGSNALPPITTDITILGEHSVLERAWDLASLPPTLFRIFQVDAGGSLRLSDVTLRNGLVIAAPGGGAMLVNPGGRAELKGVKLTQNNASTTGVNGGAITNLGTTVLTDTKFTLNNAQNSGGAVFNTGTLTVHDSHFEANKSRTPVPPTPQPGSAIGGGAIASTAGAVTIRKSNFVGNQTAGNGGGLLLAGGSAAVSDSTFRLNVALTNGGGIAVTEGNLQLRNVKFVENTTLGAGGGLYTFAGSTTTILPGDDKWTSELADRYRGEGAPGQGTKAKGSEDKGGKGGMDEPQPDGLQPGGDGSEYEKKVERYNGTTFFGNVAGTDGGAIFNGGILTMSDSVLLRNQAGNNGGGINNAAGATLVVQRSVITENQAGTTGGGIFNAGTATIDVKTLVFRNNPNNCNGPNPIVNCQG